MPHRNETLRRREPEEPEWFETGDARGEERSKIDDGG
jgi:hypothetical protein